MVLGFVVVVLSLSLSRFPLLEPAKRKSEYERNELERVSPGLVVRLGDALSVAEGIEQLHMLSGIALLFMEDSEIM